jgi:diguanylate cyclase (GGDEF)-like protein/PAS domain S-box-containing protein
MEKKILRLLIVDDSPDDTETAVAVVRKGGFMIKSQRVQDLPGMQTALEKGHWDIVLSEFAFAHFGARMALDLIRQAGLDIPFIVLTREISDADLVQVMQAGARDVVFKNQPARLPPAIARELAVADMARAYRSATVALQEVENTNRAVIEGSREAISYSQDGMHINANKAYLSLFGYEDAADLEGIPVLNLIDKNDHARFKDLARKLAKGVAVESQEFVGIKQDGARFPVEFTLSPIVLNGENCTQIVATDVSRRKAVESKLLYLNQHDPLTGLFNRHHFLQEVAKAVEQAKSGQGTSAILHVNVGQMQEINDTLGYATGDRLLIRLGKLLREQLGSDVLLSRFGGDEFAALVPGGDAAYMAETQKSLRAALDASPFSEGGKAYPLQCEFNVAVIDKATENAQQALSRALRAMSKPRPAPVVVEVPPAQAPAAPAAAAEPAVETPRTRAAVPTAAHGWRDRISAALRKNGFVLAYQPIVNLHGDPAEFFEVLVRMIGDNGELISAGQFMPAAEQVGLSMDVDRWVVRHAIESLSALHREGRKASFFINICATAFIDKELLPLIGQTLFSTGVKHKYVIFEGDEAAIASAPTAAAAFVKAVRQLGCRFSVDSFGKKPHALEMMRGMSLNFLKVDGEIVRNLVTDPVNQDSLRGIVEVAKALNVQTIAKSVEKAENLAMLWNFGLDYVQGNYFQEADTELSYEYTGETTLASDAPQSPSWANR